MGWIYPRASGIMWNAWSLGVSSLNARKVRLYLTMPRASCAFNDNDNLDDNLFGHTDSTDITDFLIP